MATRNFYSYYIWSILSSSFDALSRFESSGGLSLGWGWNPAPSENTTSLPQSPRGSLRSQEHRQISELSEAGGVKPKKHLQDEISIENCYKGTKKLMIPIALCSVF